jgi:hypothetical protein
MPMRLQYRVLEVWGESQDSAACLMVVKLYRVRNLPSPTVHAGCAELRDFLRRYPAAADPRKVGECGA